MIAAIQKKGLGRVGYLLLVGLILFSGLLIQKPQKVSALDDDTYPLSWSSAPCEWPGAGSCTNYDWYMDENGDGMFTGNSCDGAAPSGECFDNFGYQYRNCTSYVAQKISQMFDVDISGLGNAKDWYTNATGAKYSSGDTNPQVGDIGVWTSGSFGHLAYVAAVNNNVVTFDEYNFAGTGAYSNSYTSATRSNGAPNHYIHLTANHLNDPPVTPPSTPSPLEASGNAIASWQSGRLDIVEEGTNTSGTNSHHLWFDAGWQPWGGLTSLSSQTTSPLAITSWGVGRLDVFGRGASGDLLHTYFTSATGWHDWESLGGCITGAPSASTSGANTLNVFARGCSGSTNTLFHKWFESSSGWHDWETLPYAQTITSSPSSISWSSSRVDVFARGSGNDLVHTYFDANGWHDWDSLGGCISSTPGVSSWASGRLDVFALGCSGSTNTLFHKWFDSNGWHDWAVIPMTQGTASAPSAVSWGSDRIDVVAKGMSGNLLHTYFETTSGWHDWESLGGSIL